MKILVVYQHYKPEPFRIHEICEDLVKRGHSVTAVVGLPDYPTGKIPREYRFFRKRRETINGVDVRRCFEIGRRNTKAGLALNYASYMLSGSLKALFLRHDFDVVYAYNTSPVLMAVPAMVYRAFFKTKVMLHVMDIWPACLAAMNVREGQWFYTWMKRVSRNIYQRADRLVYSSRRFRTYLKDVHHIDVSKENYLPQFADDVFGALPAHTPSEVTELVFAGNIGRVQGVETLVQAAAILKKQPIRWHILGNGANYESCRTLAKELKLDEQVVFYGRRPVEEMPKFFAMADALLVSMRGEEYVSFTLPGKVQSYMAAGKPILGSISGEAEDIIREAQCGLCAPSDDPKAFAEIVMKFTADERRGGMGKNARRYYETHFAKQGLMDTLERMLKELAGEQP
ncbi:MAG: glycosyltransferase family 4 protein [Clostridiales bacterium]|nr:glycosyltransferase family 4 protein [Clostridiales bacterium]